MGSAFRVSACSRVAVLWGLFSLASVSGVWGKGAPAVSPSASGAASETTGVKVDLRSELLRIEEAVNVLLKEPERWGMQLSSGAQKFGLPSALNMADKQISDLANSPVIEQRISSLKADIQAKKISGESETPSADQAEYLRKLNSLEERLDALNARYASAVTALEFQRQNFVRWLLLWETETAMEGQAEADKCMVRLLSKAKAAKEQLQRGGDANPVSGKRESQFQKEAAMNSSPQKSDASKKPSQNFAAAVANQGVSPAGSAAMRAEQSGVVGARNEKQLPPMSKGSSGKSGEGRLISLDEAIAIQAVEKGRPFYLSGEFVVTASGNNRAVLRSAQGGGASLDSRVIVEYGSGFSPPPPGTTFLQNTEGRFEIREVRRSQDGKVTVHVRDAGTN